MTRKDYIVIGDVLKQSQQQVKKDDIVKVLVKAFKQDNKRFDEDRFLNYINN